MTVDQTNPIVKLSVDGPIATITLNDPAKRNALSLPMFDALDSIIAATAVNQSIQIVLLCGEGSAFCAGFDLVAAVNDPALMATFIYRLSSLNRSLRRLPQVVVASVQGAAIAGGCAILSACDFVFVAADAQLGYPVHRIGVSPAVTIPTLQQAIGPGGARSLLMSGELISGVEAHRIGLATHLAESGKTVLAAAQAHCKALAAKGPNALRVTKAWLNELDGSLSDDRFDQPACASAELTHDEASRTMLVEWNAKSRPKSNS